MDIKEYIESGVLEQYVLGELSLQEAKEVEELAARHEDIADEIHEISLAFEEYAHAHRKTPSNELRTSILDVIEENENSREDKAEVATKNSTGVRILAIAASLLFIVSLGVNLYQQKQINQKEQELNDLYAEQEVLANSNQEFKTKYEKAEQRLEWLQNPDVKQILIKGSDLSPESYAFIHWNESNKKATLSGVNLPNPIAQKQYQLWAIVDGTPVDLGVFDHQSEIIEIKKPIENPSAFAVTLEEKGGKPQPNLEQLYLIGNV